MSAANGAKRTRIRPGRRESLHAILEMQRVLLRIVTKKRPNDATIPRAALAWERLEDRKRIIRGKPLPGSLKPVAPSKRKEKYWTEPEKIETNEVSDTSDTSETKGA